MPPRLPERPRGRSSSEVVGVLSRCGVCGGETRFTSIPPRVEPKMTGLGRQVTSLMTAFRALKLFSLSSARARVLTTALFCARDVAFIRDVGFEWSLSLRLCTRFPCVRHPGVLEEVVQTLNLLNCCGAVSVCLRGSAQAYCAAPSKQTRTETKKMYKNMRDNLYS